MKRIILLICLVLFVCPLILTSCDVSISESSDVSDKADRDDADKEGKEDEKAESAYAWVFSADIASSLEIALTDGSVGAIKEVGERYSQEVADETGNFCWSKLVTLSKKELGRFKDGLMSPASVMLSEDGIYVDRAMLNAPVYGLDGRIQGLEPCSCGTNDESDQEFKVNSDYGFRQIGFSQDGGLINDKYGCAVDLAFRSSGDKDASLVLLVNEGSAVSFKVEKEGLEGDACKEIVSAMRLVFFDTEDHTFLAVAGFDAENVVYTDNGITVPVRLLDGNAGFAGICELNSKETERVSVIFYLDGNYLTNQAVGFAFSVGVTEVGLKLNFSTVSEGAEETK